MTTISLGLTLRELLKYGEKIKQVNPEFYWRSVYTYNPSNPETYNNRAFIAGDLLRFRDTMRRADGGSYLHFEDALHYRITDAYVARKLLGVQFHIRTICDD